MSPQDFILQLFKSNNELTVKDIIAKMRQSRQMVHIYLRQLIAAKKIERIGHPPKSIYRLKPEAQSTKTDLHSELISPEDRGFLDNNFLLVTEKGELLEGPPGFEYYCNQRSLPINETFQAYRKACQHNNLFRDFHGIYEGSYQLLRNIEEDKVRLDNLFFLDHYTIRGFGRSRLGTLLYYAKNGQNKVLMRRLMDATLDKLRNLLYRLNPQAIAFIPPIVPRETQLVKFIQAQLDLPLPIIEIKKVYGTVAVPQQSLPSVKERINNARSIFAITERQRFQHVVLIDDIVASGATLNEVAGKIRDKGTAARVSALAIVSSTDVFRPISAPIIQRS